MTLLLRLQARGSLTTMLLSLSETSDHHYFFCAIAKGGVLQQLV